VFADRSNDWRLAREEIFGERRRLLELARVDLAPPGLMLAMTPGCNVSATIRIFSSFDQQRRRSAPSRTSTRIDLMTLKLDLRSQSPETVISPQGDLHRMHTFSIWCDSVRRTRRF